MGKNNVAQDIEHNLTSINLILVFCLSTVFSLITELGLFGNVLSFYIMKVQKK